MKSWTEELHSRINVRRSAVTTAVPHSRTPNAEQQWHRDETGTIIHKVDIMQTDIQYTKLSPIPFLYHIWLSICFPIMCSPAIPGHYTTILSCPIIYTAYFTPSLPLPFHPLTSSPTPSPSLPHVTQVLTNEWSSQAERISWKNR